MNAWSDMPPQMKGGEEKNRAALWRETVFGWTLQVVGLGLIVWFVWHETSAEHADHDSGVLILGVGVVLLAWGGFKTNTKLSKEWFSEVGKLLRFWKGGGA